MSGILVIGEISENAVSSSTFEVIAAARQLNGGLGEEVAVCLVGKDIKGLAKGLIECGADKVYLGEDEHLQTFQQEAYLAAVEKVCKQVNPTIVLAPRTDISSQIAPRLAFRLGVGLAQDCLALSVDPDSKNLKATRPVFGGNANAVITFDGSGPYFATLRTKVFEGLKQDTSRSGEIIEIDLSIDPSIMKTKLVETVREQVEGIRLEAAPIVVAGGRGLGGPDPFKQLEELANLLGGAMGASRAACDAGWLDHSYQVGLTGKTVTPNLYLAVAISGASQHMAGCSASKNIVAINKDADANIFKDARYGVTGDWKTVLPAFIETVKELINS